MKKNIILLTVMRSIDYIQNYRKGQQNIIKTMRMINYDPSLLKYSFLDSF